MGDYRIIEVKRSVFEDNNRDAERLRTQLKGEGTFLVNLMSSSRRGQDHHVEAHHRGAEG